MALTAVVAGVDIGPMVHEFPSEYSCTMPFVYLAGAAFIWRTGVHACVIATKASLTIRNPLRSYRLSWNEIAGLRLDDRIYVQPVGRPEIRCSAIVRSNVSMMLRRAGFIETVFSDLEGLRTERRQAQEAPTPD
ncbi:PH domain-containing protein [Frankia sp. AiPs1]|uniref:PH domain-containing protein n=1 Tax=Frankia sp. AiPs1 TaxID=573493 RepID=UPI002042EA31|nr:PH domain-containing protein [Frankia sp. AiPs1]MCM3921838.1 PH domain-containing protein [Frankia sp. AiPs1]